MNRRRFLTRAAASAALPLASSPMQAAAPTNAPAVPAGDPVGITPETIAAAERVASVEFTADQRAPLARVLADLFPVPFRDRRIVGRRPRISLRSKTPACPEADAALLHLRKCAIHIGAVSAHRDEVGVLGAARSMAGPPMSMFSIQSSKPAPACTVASNG